MALQDNLVAYYKLDGNSNDSVGSNNGTDTSITYSLANGKIDQGAGFTISPRSIIVSGSNVGISGSSPRTVCFWAKVISGTSLLGWGLESAGLLFVLQLSGTNYYFYGNNRDINTGVAYDNNWNFHCVTYDGTTLKWYLNNSIIASQALSLNTTDTPLSIGSANRNNTGYNYNGLIDEVGIWSRALSSTEVGELYNSGAGLTYPFTKTATGNFFQLFN